MPRKPNTVNKLVLALAALLALVTSSVAVASVIISNLPGNDGTFTFINAPSGGSNGGGAQDSKAAGFTLPSGPDYSLDAVDLRLNFFNLLSVPVVAIYDTTGSGNPGSSLATLLNPVISTGTGTFTFTPAAALTLLSDETYWVVVSNAALVANSFQWMASSPGVNPTGIASSAGYRFDFAPPPPVTGSTTLNSYAVNATVVAVPEPATLALFGLGLAALGLRRRERS